MTAVDFVTFLCQNLVDKPEAVVVSAEELAGMTTIHITVDQSDMGKIIGKEGRIIHSIRDLTRLLGTKQQLNLNVVLTDKPNP